MAALDRTRPMNKSELEERAKLGCSGLSLASARRTEREGFSPPQVPVAIRAPFDAGTLTLCASSSPAHALGLRAPGVQSQQAHVGPVAYPLGRPRMSPPHSHGCQPFRQRVAQVLDGPPKAEPQCAKHLAQHTSERHRERSTTDTLKLVNRKVNDGALR
jgi:hypothetical protein